MMQKMPYCGFRWLTKREMRHFNLNSIDPEGEDGYYIEVDLEIDPKYHDKFNDYPMAPEKMHVTADMLSPYSQKLNINPFNTMALYVSSDLRFYCTNEVKGHVPCVPWP